MRLSFPIVITGGLAAVFLLLGADKAGVIQLRNPIVMQAGDTGRTGDGTAVPPETQATADQGGPRSSSSGAGIEGDARTGTGAQIAQPPLPEPRPAAGGERQPQPPRATAPLAPSTPYEQTRGANRPPTADPARNPAAEGAGKGQAAAGQAEAGQGQAGQGQAGQGQAGQAPADRAGAPRDPTASGTVGGQAGSAAMPGTPAGTATGPAGNQAGTGSSRIPSAAGEQRREPGRNPADGGQNAANPGGPTEPRDMTPPTSGEGAPPPQTGEGVRLPPAR